MNWKKSVNSFTHYKGTVQALPEVADTGQAISALASFGELTGHPSLILSFIDVPQEDYFKALLYFYETNELSPALELFE